MAEKKTKKKVKRKAKKKASKKSPPQDNGKHPGGRPTVYSPDLTEKICTRLAAGDSLRKICTDEDMPSKSTVLLWVVTPDHEFSDQYIRAREAAGYSHADTMVDLADQVQEEDGIDPQRARVAMHGLAWAAERMAPKAHHSKVAHELTGKGGGPIETSDVSDREFARRVAFLLTKQANQKPEPE